MKNKKVCPHHMIIQFMKNNDGAPVSPDQIRDHFKDDPRMTHVLSIRENGTSRLSVYITDIRLMESGIVIVEKDGRKVKTYQLRNHDMFDDKGFYTGVSDKVAVVAAEQTEPPTEPSEGPHIVMPVGVASEFAMQLSS